MAFERQGWIQVIQIKIQHPRILVNKGDSVYSEIVKCFNPIRARRGGGREGGPDDQIHSCQSETSYSMMPMQTL